MPLFKTSKAYMPQSIDELDDRHIDNLGIEFIKSAALSLFLGGSFYFFLKEPITHTIFATGGISTLRYLLLHSDYFKHRRRLENTLRFDRPTIPDNTLYEEEWRDSDGLAIPPYFDLNQIEFKSVKRNVRYNEMPSLSQRLGTKLQKAKKFLSNLAQKNPLSSPIWNSPKAILTSFAMGMIVNGAFATTGWIGSAALLAIRNHTLPKHSPVVLEQTAELPDDDSQRFISAP